MRGRARRTERVLLVDDDPRLLQALSLLITRRADVDTAPDGAAGLARLRTNGPYAVVISDMRMPRMDGGEMLGAARDEYPETVRVMLTGQDDLGSAMRAINGGGVFRYLTKPCPPAELCAALDDALAEHRRAAGERLRLREAVAGSVRSLALAVDAKDPSTRSHSRRVGIVAGEIAEMLGWDADRVLALRHAGEVHDVGKIGIPDRILLAPGSLSPEEYAHMTSHCAIGERIVREFMTAEQASWVRGHHERPDGSGYPDGITDGAIPEGALILAVADVWDVMTAGRRYAPAIAGPTALREMRAASGAQFWGPAVAALEQLTGAGRSTMRETTR